MLEKILQWTDAFSVGHPLLDEQHETLIHVLNDVLTCSEEAFPDLLDRLAEYAVQHFLTEEALLTECAYPGLEEQRQEHAAYEEKIALLAYQTIKEHTDRKTILSFIQNWWVDHILKTDAAYRPYVEKLVK